MKNTNLQNAKRNKNDEFYTQYEDVSAELVRYEDQIKGKAILCPCDWDFEALSQDQKDEYFKNGKVEGINDNFAFSRFLRAKNSNIGLNSNWQNTLYFSHFNPATNEGVPFQESIKEFAKKHPDGIVISNPPFSLWNEFIELVDSLNLKFLLIGNKNAITYKGTFNLMKNNRCWLGYNSVKNFNQPDNTTKTFGNIGWFTNLDVKPRHQRLILTEKYDETKYPKYDNYDAINVNKVKEIPYDWEGYMGVPITFLDKYCPKQFEIYGIMNTGEENEGVRYANTNHGRPIINGVEKYLRIIIKNKQPEFD